MDRPFCKEIVICTRLFSRKSIAVLFFNENIKWIRSSMAMGDEDEDGKSFRVEFLLLSEKMEALSVLSHVYVYVLLIKRVIEVYAR